jgi:hypothetical protein
MSIETEPSMNRDFYTCVNLNAALENLAADLAFTAYRVALRSRTRGTWLDVELDLWRALADKVRTWRQENCRGTANGRSWS